MKISIHEVAGRKFLRAGDVTIPIDRIKVFDFTVANGGASGRSVQIVTDDPNEEYIYAFENRDKIERFIHKVSKEEWSTKNDDS